MKPTNQGSVVVITGGTAGVGRATARRFAASGANIAILARGQDGLDAAARELPRLGARDVLAISCDVADAAQVFAAADRIEQELGEIDIWINNAMTTVFGRFRTLTPEQFERVTRVTYLGFVWGTRAALDRMGPRNRGTIVQVGSALAPRDHAAASPKPHVGEHPEAQQHDEHDRHDRHGARRDHRFAELHEDERDDRDLGGGDRQRDGHAELADRDVVEAKSERGEAEQRDQRDHVPRTRHRVLALRQLLLLGVVHGRQLVVR
jgi:short chain dehydrogenase